MSNSKNEDIWPSMEIVTMNYSCFEIMRYVGIK